MRQRETETKRDCVGQEGRDLTMVVVFVPAHNSVREEVEQSISGQSADSQRDQELYCVLVKFPE